MIGAIGQTAAMTGAQDRGAAHKAQAVGHQAKAAVIAAREAGADLPKNAQGMAASEIAKGADPESIFAALVTQNEVPADDSVEGDVPQDMAAATEPTDSAEGAGDGLIGDMTEDSPVASAEVSAPDTGEDGLATAAADAEAQTAAIAAFAEAPASLSAEDVAMTLLEEAAAE